MNTIILISNRRLKLAVLRVRGFGRSEPALTEVREAIKQRHLIRQQASFMRWMMQHEHELRYRFDLFVMRHALSHVSNEFNRFREFCWTEYTKN